MPHPPEWPGYGPQPGEQPSRSAVAAGHGDQHSGYPYQSHPQQSHPQQSPHQGSRYLYQGHPYPYAHPVQRPPVNGMSIAALVVSVFSAVSLCGSYGVGGYLGVLGAILGHVARRQIRNRGQGGDGMAQAGIIVGWIAAGISLLATAVIVIILLNPGATQNL